MATAGHVSTIPTSRKVVCVVYGAIAVTALILTWANAAPYIHSLTGFVVTIWQDAKVNEASQFVAAEMDMLAVSSVVLMVIEGRRYGVRFVWAYVAVGYIIAISMAFPLFLIARELKIGTSEDGPRPGRIDTILLAALATFAVALTVWISFG